MENIKNFTAILLVAAIGVIACFFPRPLAPVGSGGSSVGSTFSSAKVAAIVMSPTTGTATSTSILNTDSNDRIVQDFFTSCNTVGTSKTAYTGAGLANLIVTAATTSTNAPTALLSALNTNYVGYNIVSTSSPEFYVSSTTIAVAAYGRVWAANSYLTFQTNATNTAACIVGVHYLGT